MEITLTTILVSAVVVLLAFTFKTTFGFGGAFLTIAGLSFFFDTKDATIVESLLELTIILPLVGFFFKNFNLKESIPFLVGAILGVPVGYFIFDIVDADVLSKLLGIFVLLFGSYSIYELKFKKLGSLSKGWGYVFGILGGLLRGSIGAAAPAYVFYFTRRPITKDTLRATMLGITGMSFLYRNIIFFLNGDIAEVHMMFVVLLTPIVYLAVILGNFISTKLEVKNFKLMAIYFLMVVGVLLLF